MIMSRNHLDFHKPANPDIRWKIVDLETNEILAQHTPYRKKRCKPMTPWKGSWAQLQEDGSACEEYEEV
jgi:hypothetical protein